MGFKGRAGSDNSEKQPSNDQTVQISVQADGQLLIETWVTLCFRKLSDYLHDLKNVSNISKEYSIRH